MAATTERGSAGRRRAVGRAGVWAAVFVTLYAGCNGVHEVNRHRGITRLQRLERTIPAALSSGTDRANAERV